MAQKTSLEGAGQATGRLWFPSHSSGHVVGHGVFHIRRILECVCFGGLKVQIFGFR